jgi:hypothetical protein
MTKIVVGTDGSENATAALRWAVEEADVHQADVEVVLVWSYLDQYHPDRSDTFDPDYTEDSARAALASWITQDLGAGLRSSSGWCSTYPRRRCSRPATPPTC